MRDTGIIFVHDKDARATDACVVTEGAPARGCASLRMGPGSDTGGLDLRENDPRDPEDDHVDLARGIALGIVVGILMWGLAALIVWAMWR